MGRKSRLTPEVQEKLVIFIKDGFNLRDACYGAGVAVSSFNRWRNRYPEFDKAINEATSRQWESSLALAKYGCRKYQRKFSLPHKYPSLPQKPLCEPLRASQNLFTEQDKSTQGQTMYDLPIKDMYSADLETNKRYYDPKTEKVFYRDKSRCLHSMPLNCYLRQKQDNSSSFFGVII